LEEADNDQSCGSSHEKFRKESEIARINRELTVKFNNLLFTSICSWSLLLAPFGSVALLLSILEDMSLEPRYFALA
jgi:hypothetical protein